ncbi:hypothetical protein T440DRAFT_398322 [Plenodomus tracheiphilus IPT5]|uniref:Uncharacterized protein n=1 Tax=Plenodomus tracheiphilus IPT5 TaxID=1408161 RepID=A0A6A7B3I6_9PLEO|nr:hypothetical protein T440DRAFT_398322 [Plenodomus tracheiphilus IPT5]
MATPNPGADMTDFFDFGEAAMPDSQQDTEFDLSALQNQESNAPNDNTGEPSQLPHTSTKSADFNTDFSCYLPQYQKPAQPCDYCRSKSLECFIYNSGPDQCCSPCCSPCSALFRTCSFSNPDKAAVSKRRTALDTLDVVTENDAHQYGGLTGRKQMRSLGHMGPIEDENEDEQGPKKGAAAARFPRPATKILKEWMIAHIDHPYPTEDEKEALMQQTGLSLGQISNWMANTRRRQKARPKRNSSPSIRPSTEIINIPAGKKWETMSKYNDPQFSRSHKTLASATAGKFVTFRLEDKKPDVGHPFERWKHSPPENEPAPLTAIAQAVETFDLPESTSLSSSYHKDTSNHSTGSFSIFKAPSISSLETGLTNMSSGSHNSAYSYGSRHSLGSMTSLKSKERRRRRRLPTRAPKADADAGPRVFQCTFCTDRFKSKYDWSRHEKSLHLSLEKWLCAPIGEIVADKATGKPRCVYCDELDPSKEHLSTHNHVACYEKGPESRTFYRKDHLRQHLRLMHGCKMTSSMDSWKSEAQYIKSRCGFCAMSFDKWQDRIDHLAKEFRNGANMKNWKGCRGLDPHVAMHVTNAMPPYLIANESMSPFPFSASNTASIKQLNIQREGSDLEYLIPNVDTSPTCDLSVAYQEGQNASTIGPIVLTTPASYNASQSTTAHPNATCWEILTLRLGKFAREQIEKHGSSTITDCMLQREARNILYGDPDDTWNQTSADNPEWLTLFKKAHGIDTSVPTPGISARHEVYEDLGIHPNTVLDPSFVLENFPDLAVSTASPADLAAIFDCALAGSTRFGPSHSSGAQSPYSIPGLTGSVSASPTSPAIQAPVTNTTSSGLGVYESIAEMACTSPGGPCYGENGEAGFSTKSFGSFQVKKRSYWVDPATANLNPDQAFENAVDPFMAPVQEKTCMRTGEPGHEDFQFPSWDQLPADLQNPTTSADFSSVIPISTAGTGVPVTTATAGDGTMSWDDGDMNFAMDMDMDFEFNMLGN